MAFLLKGALIEYQSDFLGPIPKVVLFQFNPEKLVRTIQVPPRPVGTGAREGSQAGELPLEKISLTAHFSAADGMNRKNPLHFAFGVGHQLAALEMMVHPTTEGQKLMGRFIDKVGLGSKKQEVDAEQPIPRETFPKILFVWGPYRILPVIIETMTINELIYDKLLNPIQAEVVLGLTVTLDRYAGDKLGEGALYWSKLAKETQASANLANTSLKAVLDIIPFL